MPQAIHLAEFETKCRVVERRQELSGVIDATSHNSYPADLI